jgi:drug/metabolite transporter (DMT)-like permease
LTATEEVRGTPGENGGRLSGVPRPTSVAQATLLVVVAACGFGSIIIFTELAKRAGATLVTVLAGRYIGGAVLFALAAGGVRAMRVTPRRALVLLAGGGGGQAVLAFLTLKALDYVPAATVSFLFYTYPTWVAVFAVLRRSEHVDASRAAALALSLGGILLMVGSPWSGPLDPRGVALALSGAVIFALYIPFLDRVQQGIGPVVASAYVVAGAGAIFVAAGLAAGTLQTALVPRAWLPIIGLAFISTLVAFVAFLRGLSVLGPVRTAIVATIEPFWTLTLAALALGQPLRPATLFGGAMIAAAVLLLQIRRRASEPA